MTEDQLQRQIIAYLHRAVKREDAVFFHVANQRHTSRRQGAKLKAMGVLAGVADLMFLLPQGRCGFMEVKTAKGTLSEPQRAFRGACECLGHLYAVVRNIEDVERALHDWDVPVRITVMEQAA